jgi:cytochrome c peroxidase
MILIRMRHLPRPWFASLVLAVGAFAAIPFASADNASVSLTPAARPDYLADYARPTSVPAPRSNPITPEKVALGQMLFFDPRLSGSGAISCATCHNPALAWGDGLPKGIGHMGSKLGRRSPTILDVAFGEPYFWDGRAATLEEQAKGPLGSAAEMNMQTGLALARIEAMPGYQRAFAAAYPGKPISLDTIAAAIATYERTVVSGEAPFDRWVKGEETAVSEPAKRGFVLFNGKANCAVCHVGWRMTDDGFHDIGLPDADRGRAEVAPGIVQLEHAFKTPSLRNIAQRSPYMHDGSVATLAAVIDHYDSGFVRRPSLDTQMVPLGLTAAEKADLLAFLDTLTGADAPSLIPILPH